MKAPRFWYEPPGTLSRLLTPASWVWTAVTRRRLRRGRWAKLDVPVICVGNLSVGGTGKTPTVGALAGILADRHPHIVSRGYGGKNTGTLRVDPAQHSAGLVGDEPLLHAQYAPTWVSPDRFAAAEAAVAAGAKLVILDDGFQNPALAKDLSIVVVDAAVGFGNCAVLPAGPLREPIWDGLKRADLLLVIGSNQERAAFAPPQDIPIPVIEAEIVPDVDRKAWSGRRMMAFAGIGRPQKFVQALRDLGVEIVDTFELGDHEDYARHFEAYQAAERPADARFAQFLRRAKRDGVDLVTTEKDVARMPVAMRALVKSLPIRLEFRKAEALTSALAKLS